MRLRGKEGPALGSNGDIVKLRHYFDIPPDGVLVVFTPLS
jgi:hypothetical protein